MPKFEVINIYPISAPPKKYLCIEIASIAEALAERMEGVAVDFKMQNGEIVQYPVNRCFGFNGNLCLLFEGLNKAFKPIGFSSLDEESLDNTPAV